MVKYCAGATARIMSPLWRGHIIFFGKKGEKHWSNILLIGLFVLNLQTFQVVVENLIIECHELLEIYATFREALVGHDR